MPPLKAQGRVLGAAVSDATKTWMCEKQPGCLSKAQWPSEELLDASTLTGLFSLYAVE